MSMVGVPQSVDVGAAALTLRWRDEEVTLAAGTLRNACQCAECRAGFIRGGVRADHGQVLLTDAQPVGHYALQLAFSDGHDRGIFPWELLRRLCGRTAAVE
jgi:DUF971 family protein